MVKISVLLVEDNPGDADLIEEYLADSERNEYDIQHVDTLASATSVLSQNKVDVVLLDLSLPDSVGLDTVRFVTTRFPEVVIIVLTGLQDEKVALQCVRYGAQDYLEKNLVTPVLLNRSIAYSIERKRATREKENLLADLSQALEHIENLEGILPICASCKKILNKNGQWYHLEDYLRHETNARVNKSICPDCIAELHPDFQVGSGTK